MKPIYKIFTTYILLIIFILICGGAFGQVTVRYFNAEWNDANSVDWCHTDKKGLSDCTVTYIDIGKDAESQKKYEVVVVPTIIIFKDGEEIKRFQADVSFKMVATRKEVQDKINEQLIEDF